MHKIQLLHNKKTDTYTIILNVGKQYHVTIIEKTEAETLAIKLKLKITSF